jgi:hypothetical protein
LPGFRKLSALLPCDASNANAQAFDKVSCAEEG